MKIFNTTFSSIDNVFNINMDKTDNIFNTKIDHKDITYNMDIKTENIQDKYDGPYLCKSSPESDVLLSTKDKALDNDILVKKINKMKISNPSGGYTITIY